MSFPILVLSLSKGLGFWKWFLQVSARSNSIEEKDREGTGEREPSDGADTEDSKSTEEDTLKVNTALVNDAAQNAAKLAANVVHNSC